MYVFDDDINKCRPWLALQSISGFGDVAVQRMVSHFGTAQEALKAIEERSGDLSFLPFKAKSCILQGAKPDWHAVDQACKVMQGLQAWMLTFQDELYPESLKFLKDQPPVIYGIGQMALLVNNAIAIVGARHSSPYGNRLAFEMARDISLNDTTVVSGLAIGIDLSAHKGALTAQGSTIAIKGCGIDFYYPRHDRRFLDELSQKGLIISQFMPTTSPIAQNFPIRNKLISALAKGVVVVEAGLKSGSMITASCALNQGKEVMAIPGNVLSATSSGANWLIKQGAMLVENAADVLDYLGLTKSDKERQAQITVKPALKPSKTSVKSLKSLPSIALSEGEATRRHDMQLSAQEKKILDCLALEARHIDDISHETGMDIPQLSAILLEMELKDVVRAMAGQFYKAI